MNKKRFNPTNPDIPPPVSTATTEEILGITNNLVAMAKVDPNDYLIVNCCTGEYQANGNFNKISEYPKHYWKFEYRIHSLPAGSVDPSIEKDINSETDLYELEYIHAHTADLRKINELVQTIYEEFVRNDLIIYAAWVKISAVHPNEAAVKLQQPVEVPDSIHEYSRTETNLNINYFIRLDNPAVASII